MKNLKIVLTTAFILIFTGWIAAQPGQRAMQIRERVSNARLNQVAKRMNLEKERLEKLRPAYLDFDREKQKLFDKRLVNEMRIAPDSLSNDQAEQLFFMQTERAKKMIDLREYYFKEFQKVLTPKEILRFFRIEREVNKRMMEHIRSRFRNNIRR
jgi:hypothetical protein